jgi:DNA-binding NarL/FixJ family response regulator
VLLVDDSSDITRLYAKMVSAEADMECVGTLPSAEDLLKVAQQQRPDVVVLDLTMPGPDPLQVARALHEQWPQSRVLAFSGHNDEETLAAAYEAGVWGFLSKGGDAAELLAAIREVAAGRGTFGRMA